MAPTEKLMDDPPWHRRLRRLAPWLVLLALLVLVATPGWLHGPGDGRVILRPMPVLLLEAARPPEANDAELAARPLAPP